MASAIVRSQGELLCTSKNRRSQPFRLQDTNGRHHRGSTSEWANAKLRVANAFELVGSASCWCGAVRTIRAYRLAHRTAQNIIEHAHTWFDRRHMFVLGHSLPCPWIAISQPCGKPSFQVELRREPATGGAI